MSQNVGASGEVADPDREALRPFEWNPGKRVLKAIRSYQRHRGRRSPLSSLLRYTAVLSHRFWSVVAGADIPLNCKIGIGLLLPHPNGIVIHPDSVLGVNCLLFQQVTLGITVEGGVAPVLGDHVDVGAGAKILGDVRIGHRAIVGANAVVVRDVSEHTTVIGIPAREVTRSPKRADDPS